MSSHALGRMVGLKKVLAVGFKVSKVRGASGRAVTEPPARSLIRSRSWSNWPLLSPLVQRSLKFHPAGYVRARVLVQKQQLQRVLDDFDELIRVKHAESRF